MSASANRNKVILLIIVALSLCLAAGLYLSRDESTGVETAEDPLVPVSSESPVVSEAPNPPPPEKEEPGNEADAAATDFVAEAKAEPMAPPAETPLPQDAAQLEIPAGPFGAAPGLLGQESFKIEPPMRAIGQAWIDGSGREDFSMPVTGGKTLEIGVDQFEMIGREGGRFTGTVRGYPGSSVQLSYRGNSEAGSIRLPSEGKVYQILPGDQGAVIVQERELSEAEPAGNPMPSNINIPPPPTFIPPPPPNINELDPAPSP